MILSCTGHRPNKIIGFKPNSPIYNHIVSEIKKVFTTLKPDKVLTGMAEGIDQLVAEICLETGTPFLAIVPFKSQELYWEKHSRDHYFDLLSKAEDVHIVSPGGFASWKYQVRNQWLVDNSDILMGIYNGSVGGTKNCLDYCKSKNKKIIIINPNDFKQIV